MLDEWKRFFVIEGEVSTRRRVSSCYYMASLWKLNPTALSLKEYRIVIRFKLPFPPFFKKQGGRIHSNTNPPQKLHFTDNDR